ncbi:T9SS type A sorting domain-containing protein, partial [Chryseobacterium sp.]
SLPTGIYFIKIQDGKRKTLERFIKR